MTKRNWTPVILAVSGFIVAIVVGLVGIGLIFTALYRTLASEMGAVGATWITAVLLIILSLIGVLALLQVIRSMLSDMQVQEQRTDTGEQPGFLGGGLNIVSTVTNFIRRYPVPMLGVAVVSGIVFAKSPAVRKMVWRSVMRMI